MEISVPNFGFCLKCRLISLLIYDPLQVTRVLLPLLVLLCHTLSLLDCRTGALSLIKSTTAAQDHSHQASKNTQLCADHLSKLYSPLCSPLCSSTPPLTFLTPLHGASLTITVPPQPELLTTICIQIKYLSNLPPLDCLLLG